MPSVRSVSRAKRKTNGRGRATAEDRRAQEKAQQVANLLTGESVGFAIVVLALVLEGVTRKGPEDVFDEMLERFVDDVVATRHRAESARDVM